MFISALNLLEHSVNYCFAVVPRRLPETNWVAGARLIAHRGAHDNKKRVENTFAAFDQALAVGCWGIELDIHATADGILVVNHDPTLKRLWQNNAAIADIDFKRLRQICSAIPTLAEVVERYGKKLHLFIEIKSPFSAEENLKKVLSTLTACEDFHLLSLKEALFQSFSVFPLESLLLVPTHQNTRRFCQYTLQKNYGGVTGHYLLLRNHLVKQLQAANKKVGVGFVDSKNSLYRELNRHVQWLFSNKVEQVSYYLEALKQHKTVI